MIEEASMEDVGSGLAPTGPGWFVVNAADAAWCWNDALGGRCVFEATPRVLQQRPDLEPRMFGQVGYSMVVLEPGMANGKYHAESDQEDFLVLAGECDVLIEEQVRRLRAWDFVHCPPDTRHIFIGAGDGPCLVFMMGARNEEGTILYPRSEVALELGVGTERDTPEPSQAYAGYPSWRLGHGPHWEEMPWA